MTYELLEKIRASNWKRQTPTLPDEARVPAPYVGRGALFLDRRSPAPTTPTAPRQPARRSTAVAPDGRAPRQHLLSPLLGCAEDELGHPQKMAVGSLVISSSRSSIR